ncbi:hypothetical protein KPL71_023918 [Citrus sinensis]|uniref:Uncharacterized protein n=1 Tax=Citrus sinensis TaxID=2711 RepID=A0ACB8IM67_CITSI|nr:hypothetical protein KPL71_023918 [Citrus sinensis]
MLKTRLGEKKGAWVDELLGVLWAHRTTYKTATGETPFALAFRHKAVVLVEIGMSTYRTEHFDEEQNNKQIYLNLDLLLEKREVASKRAAEHQQRVARYYNQHVRVQQFKVEDWVLRKVNQNTRDPNHGVFSPNWEGPYMILRVVGAGAYKLAHVDGKEVKKP